MHDIIQFTPSAPDPAMSARIAEAKRKADAALKEKIEKSRNPDVDVRTFFTDEELEAILSGNDFFNGRIADLSRMERYKHACAAAKWLDTYSVDVSRIEIEPVSSARPNAIISIDFHRLSALRGKALRALTVLESLSDAVFLCGTADTTIRFTFGIEKIWTEE